MINRILEVMNYIAFMILIVLITSLFVIGCSKKRENGQSKIPETEKSVLDMKLSETIKVRSKLASWIIVKVPGGWVYSNFYNEYLVFVKDERKQLKQTRETR